MRASERGQDIGASPIRSLVPYAEKAKAEGKKIYHLNIGQPDIATPPQALDSIRNNDTKIVAYGLSAGQPDLRATFADYYKRFSVDIFMEDVMVTTGASEGILFTLFGCCDAGDEVIIPEPFYANYLGFAHMSNVMVKPLTTHIEDAFTLPEPSVFEQTITAKTKAILLCNPGNPTGQVYGREKLLQILDIVKKYDLFLIVDEVYKEFCYDSEFTSVLAFAEYAPHVVVIDSVSKIFSACGARVGYIVTKNESLRQAILKYAQLRLCPPYYGQRLALSCYEDLDYYLGGVKEEYRNRREVMYQCLSDIPDIKFYRPTAAFYVIAELPVDNAEVFCRWMLESFNKDNATVMLAPAAGFYANKSIGRSQVRIAYVLNEDDLKAAMNCLKEGLREYRK